MKKMCFSILVLSLLLACLTACGAQAKQPDEPPPAPQVTQTEAVIPDTEPEQPAEPAPEPIADIEPIATPEPIAAVEPEPEPAPENPLTFTDCNETVYAIDTVNLRSGPSTDYEKVGSLSTGDSVARTGIGTGDFENWSRVTLSDGTEVYVNNGYISTTKPVVQQTTKSGGGTTQSKGNNGKTSTSSTPSSTPSGGSSSTSSSTSDDSWAKENGYGLAALLESTDGIQFEDPSAAEGRYNDPSTRVSMN